MATRAHHVTKKDVEALRQDLDAMGDGLRSDIRAIGVLFEQSRSDVQAIADLVLACASKSDVARVEAGMVDLSRRLSNVEAAVREHSSDLRKHTDDLRLLRNEVAQLRIQFDRRDLRADELERRIAEVERRVGIAR